MDDAVFEHSKAFKQGELSGGIQLDKFEVFYEHLFTEAMEDGVITPQERVTLEKAAASMGLDRARLYQVEQALLAAFEARHGVAVVQGTPGFAADDAPRASLSVMEAGADPRPQALQRRVAQLEQRVAELEQELAHARAQAAVDVDFSDLEAHDDLPAAADEVEELRRRLRHDPRNADLLRVLLRALGRRGEIDQQWCVAHALCHLGEADGPQREIHERWRPAGLIQPSGSVSADAWRRLVAHADEEVLTGQFFAVVVSAVLLGHVAALRHARLLPELPEQRRQHPTGTTVQASRCFFWAASILGMPAPPVYADPAWDGMVHMVPGVPPAARLGKLALSGRSAAELAFVAGSHLAWYREDRFMRLLAPNVADLEDLFLAALTIGNPGLPLHSGVKRRVAPIAAAIEPILDAAQIDRLRGHFLRFVEEGGRTNLQRWAAGADRTALRAGLLLCNDLGVAQRMLELARAGAAAERPGQGAPPASPASAGGDERMDDLIAFMCSDAYGRLRRQLGIAATAQS
ncbi:MAG: hypothetical protein HY744_03595 [Deltaproteobacteria bacterium]|nr:hypothetical protein [Deltaproteobacteria bacterium]